MRTRRNGGYGIDDKLIEAARIGHSAIVDRLINAGADFQARDNAALMSAVLYGHTGIVKLLLDAGADPDARNGEALRLARFEQHHDIIRLLEIEYKYIGDQIDNELIEAARIGHIATVDRLIDAGADVQARDDEALISAVRYGHTGIVKLLLDAGADPDARYGEALRLARFEQNHDIIRLLENDEYIGDLIYRPRRRRAY